MGADVVGGGGQGALGQICRLAESVEGEMGRGEGGGTVWVVWISLDGCR